MVNIPESNENPKNFNELLNRYTNTIEEIYGISPDMAVYVITENINQLNLKLAILRIPEEFHLELSSSIYDLRKVFESLNIFPTVISRIFNVFERYPGQSVKTIGDMLIAMKDPKIKLGKDLRNTLTEVLRRLNLYTEDVES